MTPPTENAQPGTPAPLVVAAGLTFIEGLMTLGYGISEAANTTSDRFVMGASTTLFFVVYGAALILCAWGMNSLRSWSRGPVLFSQLAWLGLAWNFRTGGTWPISVILAVPAVLVLLALLQPASLDALNRHDQP